MKSLRFAAPLAAILLVLSTSPAEAWGWFSISNNGPGSVNRLLSSFSRTRTYSQNNSMTSSTSISISSSTGENTISGTTGGSSTVTTGNSSSSVHVSTSGNSNFLHVESCCDDGGDDCEPTPSPTPTDEPTPTPTDEPTPSPTPTPSCENITVWADAIEDADQGTLKTGDPITDADRTDSSNALGEPDGEFFSIGKDGWITVTFADPVVDLDGDDLSFHEVTQGRDSYPEETAEVEVFSDGSWVSLGTISNMTAGSGVDYLDLSDAGVSETTMVRISDTTDYDLHNDEADGYDLDAVDAVQQVCE